MGKVKALLIYRYSSENEILLIKPGISPEGKKKIQANTKLVLQQLKQSNLGAYERQKIVISDSSSSPSLSDSFSSSSSGFSQNQWYCVCDSQDIISIVVCSENYPERKAYEMIDSLRNHFLLLGENYSEKENQEIQSHSQTAAENLLTEYNQENIDSIGKVSSILKDTQNVMQVNLSQIISNTADLEETRRKSQQLELQSQKLKSKSKYANSTMRCNNIKLILFLSLVVIGIILIIVFQTVNFKK